MTFDKQAAFNRSVKGLASQGFRRSTGNYNGASGCAYRGRDGRRCALGWLIPDKRYDRALENQVPDYCDELLVAVLGKKTRSTKTISFLRYLQEAHDFSESPNDMKMNLRNFAEEHKLKLPKVLR